MLAELRQRLTFANAVSLIALFVALGGSSYAAVTLKKNSVKSSHLKNGQVKNPDLGANAVTTSKVKNGSLLAQDFATGQLPKGETGDPGAPGQPGSSAASALIGRGFAEEGPSATGFCTASGGAAVSNNCVFGAPNDANVIQGSPKAGVLARDLFVRQSVAPGAGAARSFTLYVNGNPTLVTCTVTHPSTTCDSGGATHTIPGGSTISLKYENSVTTPTGTPFTFGWRAVTP